MAGYFYDQNVNFNTKLSASFVKRRKLFRKGNKFTDKSHPFIGLLYTDLNRKVFLVNIINPNLSELIFLVVVTAECHLDVRLRFN